MLFILVLLLVARYERQRLKVFEPLVPGDQPELSPYALAMNQMAAARGFQSEETWRHAKGGTYRLFGTAWMSTCRTVVAMVGGGRMARMPYRRTLLYSPLADGRYLVTSDEFSGADISGVCLRQQVINGDFHELLAAHVQALGRLGPHADAWQGCRAWEAIERLEAQRVARTLEKGYGEMVGPDVGVWRHTWKGA